jgi:hypothetical protein
MVDRSSENFTERISESKPDFADLAINPTVITIK